MFKKHKCGIINNNKWVRWWTLGCAFAMVASGFVMPSNRPAKALKCPELKVLFARGSGSERYESDDYKAFKEAMEAKLETTGLVYEIDDLDYPAVSIDVGDGHLGTLVGAYFGGGTAYEFGDSVRIGVENLLQIVNSSECSNTKYVLAGYSQGAIVLLDALNWISPDKLAFVATFGDPKIYLPEGAGMVPKACGGKNLSEYRIYVPDCRAYKGILGAWIPYIKESYAGKVGTWCNKRDVLCSSYYGIKDHVSYAPDGIYEDASRYILSKIGKVFGITNQYTSPHDTAILIDSTGSMEWLIERYKAEALRLAEKTLNAGGRVALYDYRDLGDGYTPVERCSFETCDLNTFRRGLEMIGIDGGGDTPESLLSASVHVMNRLNWNFGSTKSLVILTDAGYHSPDLDGTTFYDVQKLSKQIDPVNFYIITDEEDLEVYRELAEATGGAVATSADDLGLLTDAIMERWDSLPRVEEEFIDEEYDNDLPVLQVEKVEENADGEIRVVFRNSGKATVVVLNGAILGTTLENDIVIGGLRPEIENELMLVPISETRRGEGVRVELAGFGGESDGGDDGNSGEGWYSEGDGYSGGDEGLVVPKVPNTGKARVW